MKGVLQKIQILIKFDVFAFLASSSGKKASRGPQHCRACSELGLQVLRKGHDCPNKQSDGNKSQSSTASTKKSSRKSKASSGKDSTTRRKSKRRKAGQKDAGQSSEPPPPPSPPPRTKSYHDGKLIQIFPQSTPPAAVVALGFDKKELRRGAGVRSHIGNSDGHEKDVPSDCRSPLELFTLLMGSIDELVLDHNNKLQTGASSSKSDGQPSDFEFIHFGEESDDDGDEDNEVSSSSDDDSSDDESAGGYPSKSRGLPSPADLDRLKSLFFATGLAPAPSVKDYWKTDSKSRSLYGDFVRNLMSRNEYQRIRRDTHFPGNDIVNEFRENAKKHWEPGQVIVTDECIFAFLGRWAARVHIKNKPSEDGIKLFLNVDRQKYCFDVWMYQGAKSSRSTKTKDIVLDFCEDLKTGIPYIMIADAYFGYLEVAQELDKKGINFILACGKNHPSALFSKYLHKYVKKKGQFACCTDGKLTAITLKDRGVVNLLTNMAGPTAVDLYYSTSRGKAHPLPRAVSLYRKYLGGVDTYDHLVQQYLSKVKSTKWTQAVYKGISQMCLVNSWVLYNILAPNEKMGLKDYQMEIAFQLKKRAEQMQPRLTPKRARPSSSKHDHWPAPAEKAGLCLHCKANNKLSNSTYTCTGCDVHLHTLCFGPYHAR